MHKRKRHVCNSWRLDETYIKVGGTDRYLYRAVDKFGNIVDFLINQEKDERISSKVFK
jgi:putative transposase